eukprot:CAMPEP_0119129784 /NCGR_PEP_ID=MMETSP1310-20130426/7386_1 /TAXON_ID=464262 /ORGANISM="Genus nov. species nov., Strain RCC2339" /LENGTH=161 /DNA_ID=CAMNT_0007120229 /DNA_START=59 /DNA_END=544 /DNA_ORIENTATION=+
MALNPNPMVYEVREVEEEKRRARREERPEDDDEEDPFDAYEIYDLIRCIGDPEHPLTLEQLNVVRAEHVQCDAEDPYVCIHFTPTIPHCSMAQLIGLCIRVKLMRSLPGRFKVDVFVSPGTHSSEEAVNKQLNDKERVAAALENQKLLQVINGCIAPSRSS